MLDKYKFEYINQFEVKEKFLVDAFIPKRNIIIQFDGDYWHGNPNKYTDLTERQLKQIRKDRSQDKYLKACGYNVIRVWESELKKDESILICLIDELLIKTNSNKN